LVQVAGSKLYAAAMDAEKVLDGLGQVVELLQSRSGWWRGHWMILFKYLVQICF
jgi:hypothetical protein